MASNIQPLRIHKGTPLNSPGKIAAPTQRPLAELSSTAQRRNSPSYNQTTKKSLLDSSPFDSSPFAAKFENSPFASNSPRAYWQNRDSVSPTRFGAENQDPRGGSPSPAKRSSIENLKRASRVKNSSMFAREQKQEYDPTSVPVVERPLASGRPLTTKNSQYIQNEHNKEAARALPVSPTKSQPIVQSIEAPSSPSKGQQSPSKSSLSKNSRYARAFEDEDICSDEDRQLPPGRSLHRHAKSVTFDKAPPQVNEYEMTTPDPSSVASGSREGSYESFDGEEDEYDDYGRGSSLDREDSFDAELEDTDKTPVVLPEDWRHISPDTANADLASPADDVFDARDKTPDPVVRSTPLGLLSTPIRTDSVNSNGERRPLPPLPALEPPSFPRARSDSSGSLQAAAERMQSVQKPVPSPPRPASMTKSELQQLAGNSMPIEERLRLMMIQDEDKSQTVKSAAEQQRERRLRRGDKNSTEIKIHEDEPEVEQMDYTPKISRESILRKVKSKKLEDDYDFNSSPFGGSNSINLDFDPDVPLPTLGERAVSEEAEEVVVKQEDAESVVDVYAIPDMYRDQPTPVQIESFQQESAKEATPQDFDDDASHYSTDLNGEHFTPGQQFFDAREKRDTPHAPTSNTRDSVLTEIEGNRISLPQFASMLGEDDFGLSLSSYMTPSPPVGEPTKTLRSAPTPVLAPRPSTPIEQIKPSTPVEDDRENTPDSVIRHPLNDLPMSESPDIPDIPQPVATIRAPSGGLKTRPSLAPADIKAMAETRRQVSGQQPSVPDIPERSPARPSLIPEGESYAENEEDEHTTGKSTHRRSSLVQLEVPDDVIDEGLSIGLDKEFERLIEAQKKGYLMRQNTKMVVASSASHDSNPDLGPGEAHLRGTRSAGNSPRKPSQQTWTTEPWNGKIRRKSIRQSFGNPSKEDGPAPPLPGQTSNVTSGLESVAEDEMACNAEELVMGGERGSLFVKVVGVKDLDLPLPKGERCYFAVVLDNGLHCVTTAWLELGRNAMIGQEFELVVLDDLEFHLTLKTKLEQPKPKMIARPDSPTKAAKASKASTFSRVFASPRKRKEMELKQQEEEKAARQREAAVRTAPASAWDLQHNLVAEDGNFARAFISLKDYEDQSFGRPYTVDVPCFNEWAVEEVRTVGSNRSGRNSAVASMQRKAPYRIGKLELQLLFVPKPKDAQEGDMPKSINACIRELQEAESTTSQTWEGHLSQQGGDCPFWRRRFFRLEQSKLTAYHEATRQPRATINLAKAKKLIDDKSALTQKETSGRGGSRRKSAFAAEEEGYMFVEEGFRVRFENGETIDFYADSTAEKEGWMVALSEVVGKDAKQTKKWTDLVLKREKALASKAKHVGQEQIKPTGLRQAAPQTALRGSASPSKKPVPTSSRPYSQQGHRPSASESKPAPVPKDLKNMTPAERRAKTRSMVF